MGELAFKLRRDARMPCSDLRCPVRPSGRWTGGPRVVTAWPCGKCMGIRTECRDAGSRVCEVHYSHHASGSDRRSDAVRRLTCVMIQTHVTCDSSPLRAARENRSRRAARRVLPNARDGPHSPLPRAHGYADRERPCRGQANEGVLVRAIRPNGKCARDHSEAWTGYRPVPSRAARCAPTAWTGTAAHGGNACRSRAARPDHAPTSKGWEHDPL